MRNKNKIVAIIVAILLIVSVFVVGTVANTKNTSITIAVDKTELAAGQTATVTVTASADYPVATASIPVFYDKTMVTVSNATATLAGYDVANVTTDLTATDSSKVYENTGVDSSKFGFVLVTYIGGANDTVSTLENATVLTFTITAKTDVSGSAVVKCVTESAKTDDNVAGMLYSGTTTSGTTITSIPENVEGIDVSSASTSVAITSETASGTQLVAATGKSTVVDATNKYVYGITSGDNVEDYISVNGGSYELVANSLGFTNGTGATVKVKDSKGAVVDTYTIIVFGDVNGDGEIKGADLNDINLCLLTGTTDSFTDVQKFAADVTGDSEIKVADKNDINLCIISGSSDSLTTNPYAN